MLKIISVSVNGGESPERREFSTLDEIKAYVPREYRGLSSYWQVRVVDASGATVARGFRAGPNGTGERWTWRAA